VISIKQNLTIFGSGNTMGDIMLNSSEILNVQNAADASDSVIQAV
jgi:hypothetical protein